MMRKKLYQLLGSAALLCLTGFSSQSVGLPGEPAKPSPVNAPALDCKDCDDREAGGGGYEHRMQSVGGDYGCDNGETFCHSEWDPGTCADMHCGCSQPGCETEELNAVASRWEGDALIAAAAEIARARDVVAVRAFLHTHSHRVSYNQIRGVLQIINQCSGRLVAQFRVESAVAEALVQATRNEVGRSLTGRESLVELP